MRFDAEPNSKAVKIIYKCSIMYKPFAKKNKTKQIYIAYKLTGRVMNASVREVYIYIILYMYVEIHRVRLLVLYTLPLHQPAGRILPLSFVFLSGIFQERRKLRFDRRTRLTRERRGE